MKFKIFLKITLKFHEISGLRLFTRVIQWAKKETKQLNLLRGGL